jgi:hypothetical protein
MSAKYQIERDLKEAESMADALEEYVRGSQLYGNASGGIFANMPSLTIGALATRLRRLDTLRTHLNAKQHETLSHAMRKHESVQREWRVHYEEKLKHEVHSRLDAMRTFFRECAESTRLCASVYAPEVLRRTVVQEVLRLMDELNVQADSADDDQDGPTLAEKLRGTDAQLRGLVKPHPFLWDDILQPAYPKDEFWWLYNKPPSPDDAKKA